MGAWEDKKLEMEAEIDRLNNVLNNITTWGANAEALQADYDKLIEDYNKHLVSTR